MPTHVPERSRQWPGLLATPELARRVDRAEIEFCALAGAVGAPGGVASLEVGGGLALYGRPGSPLNKALGVGLDGPVTDADLGRLEAFYRARGAPAHVELCPLAAADVAPRLCARGFVVQGFENQLARAAAPLAEPSDVPDVQVTRARGVETELWVRVTAEGFAAFDPAPGGTPPAEVLSLDAMMQVMSQFAHPAISRYLAWIDGTPAGGGAAWAHDGVLGIFGTATLPGYRRRGVQRAITMTAMAEAPPHVDLTIATTAPGSISQRTFERLGFAVLYTRAIFVKA